MEGGEDIVAVGVLFTEPERPASVRCTAYVREQPEKKKKKRRTATTAAGDRGRSRCGAAGLRLRRQSERISVSLYYT
jgi:hypothetical protein